MPLMRAGALLDRDAGIVGDLLPHAGEPIEERGLAAVRWPNERDGAEAAARLAGFERRLVKNSGRTEWARGSSYVLSLRHIGLPHKDVARCLAAQGNFGAFNAIYRRIAGRGTAQHVDSGIRQKAQVHQVIADLVGQLDGGHHRRPTYRDITQRHHLFLKSFTGHSLQRRPMRSHMSDYSRMCRKHQISGLVKWASDYVP